MLFRMDERAEAHRQRAADTTDSQPDQNLFARPEDRNLAPLRAAELPTALADAVMGELEPGEQVLWCARPSEARYRPLIILLGVLDGAGMLVFAAVLFVVAPELLSGEPWMIGVLLGIMAPSLVGAAAVPLHVRWLLQRTVYVITDRRALLIRMRLRTRTGSFGPGELKRLRKRRRPDGSGSVIFGINAFSYLDNVDEPYRLLEALAGQADGAERGRK